MKLPTPSRICQLLFLVLFLMSGFTGETRRVKRPYVVEELCNGCGICENVCPLEGKGGIGVFAVKDRSPLALPGEGAPGEPGVDDPYGKG